jgi:hypothetical protein
VIRNQTDPNRLIFDFDPGAPGGRGGASIRLDPVRGLASIDGVHRNIKLPNRSTGGLLADGLIQAGMPRPAILEAYNVEASTAASLGLGGTGRATRLGKLLDDVAKSLGGMVALWEPIPDGGIWHLRAHLTYP